MGELFKSVKAALYDRFGNPLIGQFIVSWVVINWRVAVPLMPYGSDGFALRVVAIDSAFVSAGWMRLLVLPIVSTLLLLTVIPWMGCVAFDLREYFREKMREIQASRGKARRLTVEESNTILMEVEKAQSDVAALMKKRDTEIADLRHQLEATSPSLRMGEAQSTDENEFDRIHNLGTNEFEAQLPGIMTGRADLENFNYYSKWASLGLLDLDTSNGFQKIQLTKKGREYARWLQLGNTDVNSSDRPKPSPRW